ncbi:hypothetical protein ACHAQA_000115 [Verticillium albo-atrum]
MRELSDTGKLLDSGDGSKLGSEGSRLELTGLLVVDALTSGGRDGSALDSGRTLLSEMGSLLADTGSLLADTGSLLADMGSLPMDSEGSILEKSEETPESAEDSIDGSRLATEESLDGSIALSDGVDDSGLELASSLDSTLWLLTTCVLASDGVT